MTEELPEGWTAASTATLLAFVTSGSRGWARYYVKRGALFLRIANLDHDSIAIDLSQKQFVEPPASVEGTRTRVRIGDLLISITADVGMVGLVQEDPGEAYINQHIALARPIEGFNREYLAWYIASTDGGLAQLRELQRGATKVGLGLDDIRSMIVPLPPLQEQDRIVAKIRVLNAKRDAIRMRLAKVSGILKRFRQAVLAAACSGELTAACRGVPVEEAWDEKPLGEVLTGIEAGRSFSCVERPPRVNEVGVLKISAVTWGVFDEDESKTCTDSAMVNKEFLVRAGDLLMTRANTIELVGAVALVERINKKLMLSDKTLRLRVGKSAVPRWVLYWLRSKYGREQIEALATGNQQSMRNISQGSIRSIRIRIPPIEEQRRIEITVEALMGLADRLEARYEIANRQVDKLTQSVLAKAFRGELVPTEAELARREGRGYETAEELLARIKNAQQTVPDHGQKQRNGVGRHARG
jgi:type I restriction enzyme S subunit